MFISGLGSSAAAPQIVLFLFRQLGTRLPVAGLFYLTSLAAPIAGDLVGSISDRTGDRLGLFRLCAAAGFLGWAGIALSTDAWVAGQILMGGVWGIFFVLGIIVAQRLLRDAVATASAIFMNAGALGLAIGVVAGGIGVAYLGTPNVFFIPAAFYLLAYSAWRRRPGPKSPMREKAPFGRRFAGQLDLIPYCPMSAPSS